MDKIFSVFGYYFIHMVKRVFFQTIKNTDIFEIIADKSFKLKNVVMRSAAIFLKIKADF